MDDIGKYLRKYATLTPPQGTKKKLLAELFRSECGVTLSENQIRLQKEGVFLDCHPAVRTEIQRHAPHLISILLERHNTRITFIR
jgi:hypothetical protein